VGADAIRAASRKGSVCASVVARDASDNAVARIGGLAGETEMVRLASREELGRAVGRGVAALVGLTDRELAMRIVAAARTGEQERNDGDGSSGRPREA
jgi:ribosomal protein L7Ae-like RNA K-turn-binding protein